MIGGHRWQAVRLAARIPLLLTLAAAALVMAACGGMPGAESAISDRAVKTGYCGEMCEMSFWLDAGVDEAQAELDAGVDLTAQEGALGGAPIHLAASYASDPQVIALLLDAGADLEYPSATMGATPLLAAAMLNPDPMVAALLVDRGADIDARTNDGRTVLHGAAEFNPNPDVVALLLDRGADASLRDDAGRTPCQIAAGKDKPQVRSLLCR